MDWEEGSQDVLATLGERRRVRRRRLRRRPRPDASARRFRSRSSPGRRRRSRSKGIFDPPTGGSPFGPVTISAAAWDAENPQPKDLYSFVKMEGGETDANAAALEQALDAYPNAKVQTREQFIDNQISGLSSVLNILYVLLALSVLVSLFGIVNTLVLTVFERTREIGMLRAIGMTRRQVRRMIRHESVITALIGAAIGIVLGLVLAGAPDRQARLRRLRVPARPGDRLRGRGGDRRRPGGDLPGPARGEARTRSRRCTTSRRARRAARVRRGRDAARRRRAPRPRRLRPPRPASRRG